MKVLINAVPTELPDDARVADAVALLAPAPPFAVAVNLAFVPQSAHARHALRPGDQIEIIAPVTGG